MCCFAVPLGGGSRSSRGPALLFLLRLHQGRMLAVGPLQKAPHMIPTFPKFKKLTVSDRPAIERFTQSLPPYSDYNFTALWCWDTESSVSLSQFNDHLLARLTDETSGEPFYSFFGRHGKYSSSVVARLFAHASANGICCELRRIPHHAVVGLEGDFRCHEDRDNHDYILDARCLAEMSGSSFATLRQQANRFRRNHPDARLCILDLRSRHVQHDVLALFRLWEKRTAKTSPREYRAIERLLNLVDSVELLGIGVYVADRLVGYEISEPLAGGFAICHFAKSDRACACLDAYIIREAARELYKRGCRFMNAEQDLGIPGLRTFKMQCRPHSFLKKWIITATTAITSQQQIAQLTKHP